MNLWEWIEAQVAKRADQEAAALDAQISEVIWQANLMDVPRVVRLDRVNVGQRYVIPGSMFPDGKARLLVNPLQPVNEPAAIAQMDKTGDISPSGEAGSGT